ncbi:MAG TPA: DUF4381 domain-containing protein [Methylomirabilota bacterium]
MADPTLALDPAARAALDKLADLAVPAPVSWLPQTWGWAALVAAAIAVAAWAWVRARRRRRANRYRVEALARLARLEAALADGATRAAAVAEIPVLLKRTALAAWPRSDVAALSGAAWVDFLRRHGGRPPLSDGAARLLDDREYHGRDELTAMSAEEARACARAARAWIEGHRVPA